MSTEIMHRTSAAKCRLNPGVATSGNHCRVCEPEHFAPAHGTDAQLATALLPLADAPDIDNVPAASSMHALMGAVAEIHTGVRQIRDALLPEPAPSLPTQDGDDGGREAAPLDPSKVKAGDAVRLERGTAVVTDVVIEAKSRGVGQFVFYTAESPDPLIPGTYYLVNTGAWTLTDHQPAPEPEPEWLEGAVAEVTPTRRPDLATRAVRGAGDMWHNTYGGMWDDDEVSARPLVVIDPAAVDVDAISEALYQKHPISSRNSADEIVPIVLAELGLGESR